MKALSLIQPWAGLIVNGHKQIETRSFRVKYRGPILIHASLKKITGDDVTDEFHKHYLKIPGDKLTYQGVRGAIIGAACLYDIVPTNEICTYTKVSDPDEMLPIYDQRNESGFAIISPDSVCISRAERAFGDYSNGRYGWLMRDPVAFSKPIPARGALGLWNIDEGYFKNMADYTTLTDEVLNYFAEHSGKYASLK